jgi:hypothetical protein
MKFEAIKTSKLIRKKQTANMVDWVEKKSRRSFKSVVIEPTPSMASRPSTSHLKAGQTAGEIESEEKASHHEHPPLFMDMDEPSWMEEPPMLPSKKATCKVSLPACHSTAFDVSLSQRASTSKNSLLGSPPT